MIQPPPGFVLDEPAAPSNQAITPPPGFTLDEEPASGAGNYWSDASRNALEGMKEWPAAAQNLGQSALNVAKLGEPFLLPTSILQAARGQPTDIGQGIKTAGQVVKALPRQLFSTGKTAWNFAIAPAQVMMGKSPAQTDFGQQFRQRPLSTAADIASVAALPAARLFRGAKAALPAAETAAPEAELAGKTAAGAMGEQLAPAAAESELAPAAALPSYLETKGGQGLNALAGIREGTVRQMTKAGQNPGTVGTQLAQWLSDEKAIGNTAAESFQKINSNLRQAGQQVGQAMDAIKASGADALLPADQALKPILDGWVERAGAATSARRAMAKPFKEIYENLAEKGKTQGGALSIEDLRSAMDEIGPLTHKGNEAVQASMSELYGTLANTRDAMVQSIAQKAANPALAQNLLNANARYSKYMRILPDVKRHAAMESVGQANLGGIFRDLKETILSGPMVSRATMKVGGLFKKPLAQEAAAAPAEAKTLSEAGAREFLKRAKGNKDLAREMARNEGWTW